MRPASNTTQRLRRWLKAADRADGLPPTPRRSSSPALAIALRRYQAHSQDHRRQYALFDASGLYRRTAHWESAAELRTLHVELQQAMAKAGGRTPNTSHIERQAAACRAEARRLRTI